MSLSSSYQLSAVSGQLSAVSSGKDNDFDFAEADG
jgi:hypothetical protein